MAKLAIKSIKMIVALLALFIGLSDYRIIGSSAFAASPSVHIEELTWMEVRDRIAAGTTIAIVPTGGTEQNGPHMVTAKHNIIVNYTAGEIARRLGNALVAPVIAYSPAGRISPPEGHMMFPGTLSVSPQTFGALLEDTARSLKNSGFRLICFIGDHGGSQETQKAVADRLTAEWQGSGVRVLQVSAYYANNGQTAWGKSMGIQDLDPEAHAGHQDTSEVMALEPAGVRNNLRGVHGEADYRTSGAMGDSTQSSAELGRHYLTLKINAAVQQILNASTPVP